MGKRWELWGYDISYFTGKLEAYMRYKGLEYDRIEPTRKQCVDVLLVNTGYMKVPVLHDRVRNVWLKDTTSIIEYLEAQTDLDGRKASVLPACPVQRFFSFLLEDYADEWMWRPALHYRWNFEADSTMNQIRFTNEFLQHSLTPVWLMRILVKERQVREYCLVDGLSTPAAIKDTEQLYLDTLKCLEAHFQKHQFLLGSRPSLADFGFMGSMFRHFSIDPTPATIMRQRAPAVYEWVARMWNAGRLSDIADFSESPAGTLPSTWYPILSRISQEYLPYLHANAVALRDGKQTFDFKTNNVTYKALPAVEFRGWCREMLQERYRQLDAASAERVGQILKETGCWDSLFKDGSIKSGLPDPDEYPVCRKRQVPSYIERLLYELNGTAWNWTSVPHAKL